MVSEGPTHRFVGVGNILVSVYWGAPGVAPLQARIPWIERTIRKHGSFGYLVLVCAEAAGSLPSKAFRDESRAQAERFGEHFVFAAAVIEGDAVIVSLVRSFLRGLNLVLRGQMDMRFFSSTEAAAEFVAERSTPSERELLDAIAALRPS